jgi:hypothetical protein
MKAEFKAVQEGFEAIWAKHIGEKKGPPWPEDERVAFLAEWNSFIAAAGWSNEEWHCALSERIRKGQLPGEKRQ